MILAVSTVGIAVGNDSPGMAVVSHKGSAVFKVIYRGATAGRVKLNIFNEGGKLILTETINGMNGFIYPLNFKGLPSGNYTIELVDGAGKQHEKIFYQPVNEIKSIHISRLKKETGKFLLSISNSQNESIRLKIFDRNELVHTESMIITGNFAQVYKINNPYSVYTFEVSDSEGNQKSFSF